MAPRRKTPAEVLSWLAATVRKMDQLLTALHDGLLEEVQGPAAAPAPGSLRTLCLDQLLPAAKPEGPQVVYAKALAQEPIPQKQFVNEEIPKTIPQEDFRWNVFADPFVGLPENSAKSDHYHKCSDQSGYYQKGSYVSDHHYTISDYQSSYKPESADKSVDFYASSDMVVDFLTGSDKPDYYKGSDKPDHVKCSDQSD